VRFVVLETRLQACRLHVETIILMGAGQKIRCKSGFFQVYEDEREECEERNTGDMAGAGPGSSCVARYAGRMCGHAGCMCVCMQGTRCGVCVCAGCMLRSEARLVGRQRLRLLTQLVTELLIAGDQAGDRLGQSHATSSKSVSGYFFF
jgi:hypothetical protein